MFSKINYNFPECCLLFQVNMVAQKLFVSLCSQCCEPSPADGSIHSVRGHTIDNGIGSRLVDGPQNGDRY